ncbi:methyltransferase [Pseudochryseolinea flava]|uniref:Methyltransferase n=1 Tax=Pseudochryseolinea flava TaxID=2059302 RepID=A0A364XTZ7_9BACT|nr:methyltransferase [Pseudochryseolinea flava]RAV97716.1 methyltransferase [Pseudochryseolinea flava]
METVVRKPFQGVLNIVRFNWHFYLIASAVVVALFILCAFVDSAMYWIYITVAAVIVLATAISLSVSYYVYDRSRLYDFSWFERIHLPQRLINIHAGFDETSAVIKARFPLATLSVFDFYDREKHTEISIERARKAYPPFEGTMKVTTDTLPSSAGSADVIFNIFALHEVRLREERIQFLKRQVELLHDDGQCIVVEHLRDVPNFLAYNIGFFHFYSRREWNANFHEAGLHLDTHFNITPFVSVFILRKRHGNTP